MLIFKLGATVAIAALATLGPIAASQASAQEVPVEPPACTAADVTVGIEQYVPGGSPAVIHQQVVYRHNDGAPTCNAYGIPTVTPLIGENLPLGNSSARGSAGESVPIELSGTGEARADVSITRAEIYDPTLCDAKTQWGYRINDEQADGPSSGDMPVKLQLDYCAGPDIAQIVVHPLQAA